MFSKSLLVVAASLVIVQSTFAIERAPTTPTEAKPCFDRAVHLLRERSPNEYKIYEMLNSETFFNIWLECDETNFNVTTALHESVHRLSFLRRRAQRNSIYSFPLPDGRFLDVTRLQFFNRDLIASDIAESDRDMYFDAYLTGRSGAQSLLVLLDELNAYTHELILARDLAPLYPRQSRVSHRDGVARMMHFTALYLKRALHQHGPLELETLDNLKHPAIANLIATLWKAAETALKQTCSLGSLGVEDAAILSKVYSPEVRSVVQDYFDLTHVDIRIAPLAECADASRNAGHFVSDSGPRVSRMTVTSNGTEQFVASEPAHSPRN